MTTDNRATREEIIAANPIVEYLQANGHKLSGTQAKPVTLCPFHDDHNPSLQINPDEGTWFCFPCGEGGSVIDFHAKSKGVSIGDAMAELSPAPREPIQRQKKQPQQMAKVASYDYTDRHGRTVFTVDRLEAPDGAKSFRQWHTNGNTRVNNLKGIERVLWRLPQVIAAKEVWLAEGEKTVLALESLGAVATTNSGGSSSWIDAYAETLTDKDVVLCHDADEAGLKWRDAVIKSLEGKVSTLRVVAPPANDNDMADTVERLGDKANDAIQKAYADTPPISRGLTMPILSAQEMVHQYKEMIKHEKEWSIDIGRIVPTSGDAIKPCAPGDVITIMAGTGVGKSLFLQNLCVSLRPLPILFFEMELASGIFAERFIAMTELVEAARVSAMIDSRGGKCDTTLWDHIYTCPESKLTMDAIEKHITRSELKIGRKPAMVVIDYIGLIRGGTGSRYERMSTIAEDLKVVAKATNTVIAIACQRSRGDDAPALSDAKDSGSIENSSSLVLALTRPERDIMNVQILKQTRGIAGESWNVPFNGAKMKLG